MRKIALVGVSTVGGGPGATGAGIILGPGGKAQYGDSIIVSVVGDAVAPHGPGAHTNAHIIEGSPNTFVNGIPLVRVGDAASCGCAVLDGDWDAFCI